MFFQADPGFGDSVLQCAEVITHEIKLEESHERRNPDLARQCHVSPVIFSLMYSGLRGTMMMGEAMKAFCMINPELHENGNSFQFKTVVG